MTGPSLASIWGQKAGAIEGFTRYSKALERADLTWDEHSLDGWLKNPKAFIPNNRMTFNGLKDAGQRRDLIAFLQSVSETKDGSPNQRTEGKSEGMTGQGQMLNLKTLDANSRVTSISHCADTYTVTTETEETHKFWEFNLRFKTDGSELGPVAGHPAIIPASMRGDRVFVIFASPAEISPFIEKGC
jgi:cytochrome c